MTRDETYLLDILIAARKILQFMAGVTREEFNRNELLQNAIIRMLEVIGEAARSVSDEAKNAQAAIPWRQMVGTRHRLVHEYFRIDLDLVWDTAHQDIPALIAQIEPLVPPEERGERGE